MPVKFGKNYYACRHLKPVYPEESIFWSYGIPL